MRATNKIKTRSWAEVADLYRRYAKGAWWLRPMVELVEQIAASEYAATLSRTRPGMGCASHMTLLVS
jgi:hypothetical protein